jgi:hypothetical protein
MFSKLTNISPLPLMFISFIISENGNYALAIGEKVHHHNLVHLSQSTKFSVRQNTPSPRQDVALVPKQYLFEIHEFHNKLEHLFSINQTSFSRFPSSKVVLAS